MCVRNDGDYIVLAIDINSITPRSLGEGVPAKRAGERSDKLWPEQS